jgi:hypothetical protein
MLERRRLPGPSSVHARDAEDRIATRAVITVTGNMEYISITTVVYIPGGGGGPGSMPLSRNPLFWDDVWVSFRLTMTSWHMPQFANNCPTIDIDYKLFF